MFLTCWISLQKPRQIGGDEDLYHLRVKVSPQGSSGDWKSQKWRRCEQMNIYGVRSTPSWWEFSSVIDICLLMLKALYKIPDLLKFHSIVSIRDVSNLRSFHLPVENENSKFLISTYQPVHLEIMGASLEYIRFVEEIYFTKMRIPKYGVRCFLSWMKVLPR